MDEQIKDELNIRKEILNQHLAKFNQLKDEQRWSEAWAQLQVTLSYANDTLKYSANLLKNMSQKIPLLSPEQQQKIADLTKQLGDRISHQTQVGENARLSAKDISEKLSTMLNEKEPIKSTESSIERSCLTHTKMICIPKKQNIH